MTDRALIRKQFERAAELEVRAGMDGYARRWAAIHQAVAEAAARRRLADGEG